MLNAVEQERDYPLDVGLGLTAQVELLQRDLECSRVETEKAKKEAWISWSEAYDCRAKLAHANGLLRKIQSDLMEIREHKCIPTNAQGQG